MEVLGLLFAIPLALVLSAVYSFVAVAFLSRQTALGSFVRRISWMLVAALIAEAAVVIAIGPVAAYDRLGWVFTAFHVCVFLLGAPAVANLVASFTVTHGWKRRVASALAGTACLLVAIILLFGNVAISEQIYGVDGDELSHE